MSSLRGSMMPLAALVRKFYRLEIRGMVALAFAYTCSGCFQEVECHSGQVQPACLQSGGSSFCALLGWIWQERRIN